MACHLTNQSVCAFPSNSFCFTKVSSNEIQIERLTFGSLLLSCSSDLIIALPFLFSWIHVNLLNAKSIFSEAFLDSCIKKSHSITLSISKPFPVKSPQIGALKVMWEKMEGWASGWLFAWVDSKTQLWKKGLTVLVSYAKCSDSSKCCDHFCFQWNSSVTQMLVTLSHGIVSLASCKVLGQTASKEPQAFVIVLWFHWSSEGELSYRVSGHFPRRHHSDPSVVLVASVLYHPPPVIHRFNWNVPEPWYRTHFQSSDGFLCRVPGVLMAL